jgi:AcrR family transcriptional regulator
MQMSPKKTLFHRDAVLGAAFEIVRRGGLGALTARSVAARLKASVAPVYKAFSSMDELTRGVLEQALRRLDEYCTKPFSDMPFLNIGIGMVVFARDESGLFQALFLSRHPAPDILRRFNESVLETMKKDPLLRLLSDVSLVRLLDQIWLYTLGLAAAVVYGQISNTRTEAIALDLKRMGNVLMFAEASGLADVDSPACEREWSRLIREKGIVMPQADLPTPKEKS